MFGVDDVHPDKIQRGPYFIEQPQDIMFQLALELNPACEDEGKCLRPSVSFSCDAGGYPQPEYVWYTEANNQV